MYVRFGGIRNTKTWSKSTVIFEKQDVQYLVANELYRQTPVDISRHSPGKVPDREGTGIRCVLYHTLVAALHIVSGH